jgi:hypothetical protein
MAAAQAVALVKSNAVSESANLLKLISCATAITSKITPRVCDISHCFEDNFGNALTYSPIISYNIKCQYLSFF